MSTQLTQTASNPIPLDDITHWAPAGSCGRLQMLRLDRVHPVVSGNKWYKLRYNVAAAIAQGRTALLTFGGGYSNHLIATAFAAREAGLQSIGIVRGYYTAGHATPTLRDCAALGMQLLPLTKVQYAAAAPAGGAQAFAEQFPEAFIIPEGGANSAGIRGAAEIAALVPGDITDVCVAVGTGATLAGLHTALGRDVRLYGFCAARSCDTAHALLKDLAHRSASLVNIFPVSDPRFGKWTDELINFTRSFYQATGIPLDVVYTAKMMTTLRDMLTEGLFEKGSRILCLHTGGLQGNPPGLFA